MNKLKSKHVLLTQDQLYWLKKHAFDSGITVNQAIREAVDRMIQAEKPPENDFYI